MEERRSCVQSGSSPAEQSAVYDVAIARRNRHRIHSEVAGQRVGESEKPREGEPEYGLEQAPDGSF
jgi:hypothetical protein